ncbi:LOW QUALITY PROTEIN: sialic acid-binding Ig-like lectin 12 [Sparus aurata]|uniref:LOW QUALITY PROTEIN: sialic acid-binding Ig-like lectin 12 n=1 Tax=Sparus aurata TaxID=8175 RepID=UPI0011C17DD4|nr:LOW QUALITY PROTEIN: sialic acid-binding Ig-like lectin 12 [Sparus aurata]
MSVMSVLCVNLVTANMLLSLFFLSGALAVCPDDSALFITAPKKMEALSGSCLQIPCSFRHEPEQEFDSNREIFGVWIKSDPKFKKYPNNVIFNNSKTNNIYPVKITGNLREKNCITLFTSLITGYTNTYYFRIETDSSKATAVCDPLQITVDDSPGRPTIEISGDLKEKESVTITCSAFTPCPHSPPKLTWNLQQDSHNKIEENTDGTFTTKIQETITLSDQHDGYNISCSATYPVNEGKHVKTAEETKTLSVSYAPKNTSVSISASAGSWVNLTCSSRAKPPVSFTWFRNSKDGLMNVSEGHFYRIEVKDGGDYYCVATNDLGNQTSSQICLNGSDSPRRPTIEISGDLKEKESVTITCSAFTPCPHSPPKLTWNLQQDSHNKIEENTDGNFTTKIQETTTLSDNNDGYNISCSATYPVNEGKHVKTAEETKTLSVSYAPKNTSVSISASAGSWVNLTCSSRAKPPVSSFTWFRNSKDGLMNVAEGHIYSFNVTDGGDYYCVATNDLGNQTSSQICLNVAENSVVWGSALGGIMVVILICLAVCVWWFQTKHQTTQQTESQRDDELAPQLPSSIAAENIHYGEIDFSKRRPEPSSDSVQDSGQQQDTVYAQVNVSEPANTSRQTADRPEDLYAQVKKK